MNTYLKYKPVWVQLVTLGALAMGIYVALGGVSIYIISFVYKISLQEIINPVTANAIAATKMAQGIISISLFGVTGFLFGYLSDQNPAQYLGLKKPNPIIFLGIGALLLLVSLPAVAWIAEVNQNIHFPKIFSALEQKMHTVDKEQEGLMKKLLTMPSFTDLLINLLVFALIPAFVEELFFRGALQRLLIGVSKSPWIGIIITGFIFSAVHGSFSGFFPRFVLGALLGALYWYSGSLWPGIIMHFLNNALQIVVVYRNPAFMDKDVHFDWWLVALSGVAMILSVIWMRKISYASYRELYDTQEDNSESEDSD